MRRMQEEQWISFTLVIGLSSAHPIDYQFHYSEPVQSVDIERLSKTMKVKRQGNAALKNVETDKSNCLFKFEPVKEQAVVYFLTVTYFCGNW